MTENHALTFFPNLILGCYFCYLKTICVIKLSIVIIIQAYCCYRQNKLQEALELLRGQEETSAVLQLESQIFYRLGRMNDCMSSYEKLQKFKIDSMDLKINIIAALVAAGRASEVQAAMKAHKVDLTTRALRDTRSFELAYNSACSLIENKKYSEAKEQLDLAKR
jgi:signal recognition particle subunit SRP72